MPYLLLLMITFCNFALALESDQQESYKVILSTRGPLTSFRQLPYGKSDHGISGSAQFNRQGLDELRTRLTGKIVKIVDLREESHIFINDTTLHLANEKNSFNRGKTISEIGMLEKQLIAELRTGPIPPLYIKEIKIEGNEKLVTFLPTSIDGIQSLTTEADLVATQPGFSYERLPVTDTTKLTDAVIERLVELKLEAEQNNTWLHCHCNAGQGRTSQALTVWCMMEEAQTKTLEKIFAQLESLGNSQLLTGEARRHPRAYWQLFHTYCATEGWNKAKWSEWSSIPN